ncbi:hypothetical protein EST38_g7946 [Candolleomyces aberdarensis]|uniref:F-box domain-containing protein n=1 Tax=Candolleomyces aberdarensis TaxID=2316362 RepID=A0A4V1Q3A5_9AGAR|nr:hypothetical protein EST38_g7946 [Candolleomyces aberdarensis]
MEQFPVEIWLSAIEYLDDKELQALIGVSRLFFELGMDRRYQEVEITTGDKKAKEWLTRLLEPQVARRVKKLTVQLIQSLYNTPPTASSSSHRSFGRHIADQLRTVVQKVVRPVTPEPNTKQPMLSDIEVLIEAFPRMVNVADFRIVTWAIPLPARDLFPLYDAAWSAFGGNLKRISICANLNGFEALIASSPNYVKLETLELEFSDLPRIDPAADAAMLTQTVVPFVNKLCPQIKTFKIRSWANLDLSPFFLNVDPFPVLKTTLMRIPFNRALSTDPSGFTKYIHESSKSLTKVALRLSPTGLALDPYIEQSLCDWMEALVSDPRCFAKVKHLDICPTHLAPGMDILHHSIQRTRESIVEFTVRDRYLGPDDVVAVVKGLKASQSLTSLRLNVLSLSAAMFDLMAQTLPGLRTLWLSTGIPENQSSLDLLGNDMKTRRYGNWKLVDLSIWQAGNELDEAIMLAILRSIPSVYRLWEDDAAVRRGDGDSVQIIRFT